MNLLQILQLNHVFLSAPLILIYMDKLIISTVLKVASLLILQIHTQEDVKLAVPPMSLN